MSKYTTEVRFICENKSGLEQSTGCDNVDEVLSHCWDKIFTTKATFFDENYRSVLCQKILKHYYLREICAETFGIWKLWLNTRLEEVMPYYNQLYKSALLEFNPLYDVDITRTHNRTVDENKTENGETTENNSSNSESTNTDNGSTTKTIKDVTTTSGSSDTDTTNSGTESENTTSRDLYSDTPQGALTGIENETYLTNARKITSENASNNSGTSKSGTDYSESVGVDGSESSTIDDTRTGSVTNSEKKNGTSVITGKVNNIEEYIETVKGKQGTGNYSDMLLKFRETFLNIDLLVIEEFSDLFFGLW